MVDLTELSPGEPSLEVLNVIVEVPKDSSHKYEYDSSLKVFRLDRVLYSPMHYPGDYGFVPGTHAEDGDPLDVLVLIDQPTFTGCLMRVRPVGHLDMEDEKGPDQKVLAVPLHDPRYEEVRDLGDVPPHRLREIEHFFTIYKELEKKHVRVIGWRDLAATGGLIRRSVEAFPSRRA
jgi:inorganic pyrophosphatase